MRQIVINKQNSLFCNAIVTVTPTYEEEKNINNLKKVITLLMAVVMLLGLVACGDDEKKPTEITVTGKTETKEFEVQTITSGDFEITVLGAESVVGIEEVPAIRIYYQYTNNASYTAKAIDDLSIDVAQNGESIGTVFTSNHVEEDANKELYVRPGATIRCTTIRELVDETSPVTFTIGDYTVSEKLDVEFDLANLPGAPAEALAITPVADPQSLVGLAAEGTFDEKYNVKITGVENTVDRSDNDAIVVHFSFTNNSDEAERFISAVKPKVFQDGIQLQETIPADLNAPAYKMKSTDCEVNQTVEVDMYYLPISTSPCEVEVCDSHISKANVEYFEERIGIIYTIE